MSIIYIHGVKVRDPQHGIEIGKSYRRWLAPKISVNGGDVQYLPVFWGDIAANFRWDLESRPKTTLLKQGGDDIFEGLGSLREAGNNSPLDQTRPSGTAEGPVLGQATAGSERPTPPLSSIPPKRRPDFLADLYLAAR